MIKFMAETKNYMNILFEESMKLFIKSGGEFPSNWDKTKKLTFLNESLSYALKYEYYEQCGVIRDYKQKIEEEG